MLGLDVLGMGCVGMGLDWIGLDNRYAFSVYTMRLTKD